VRNKLFDWGFLKQTKFEVPILSIGNLSMGGTGKTPHIEYFISKYKATHKIAVVSRGFGRKTEGFRYVSSNDFSENVGDEPLQIKKKFDEITVAVGEDRVKAIQIVLKENHEVNLILLDDAFQHRYVKRSLNILLTEYSNPFWTDLMVPAGRLREFRFGWKRADTIIITKCPETIDLKIPQSIKSKPVYFSRIAYKSPILLQGQLSKKIILVTGIANPLPLIGYLKKEDFELVYHFNFSDHHNFSGSDISTILSKANSEKDAMLLTTEKDWMRLKPFLENKAINLAYIPIGVEIENAPDDWLRI
jgi:tetraacyldisaccharide 4'-kinase